MNCPNCGSPIEPAATFCTNCGAHLSNIPPQKPVAAIPKEYKPIGAWGYVGWNILFAIPVVGFVLLIVFSFSNSNINRRNYARSFWCTLLVAVVLVIVLSIVAAATGTMDELMQALQELQGSL